MAWPKRSSKTAARPQTNNNPSASASVSSSSSSSAATVTATGAASYDPIDDEKAERSSPDDPPPAYTLLPDNTPEIHNVRILIGAHSHIPAASYIDGNNLVGPLISLSFLTDVYRPKNLEVKFHRSRTLVLRSRTMTSREIGEGGGGGGGADERVIVVGKTIGTAKLIYGFRRSGSSWQREFHILGDGRLGQGLAGDENDFWGRFDVCFPSGDANLRGGTEARLREGGEAPSRLPSGKVLVAMEE